MDTINQSGASLWLISDFNRLKLKWICLASWGKKSMLHIGSERQLRPTSWRAEAERALRVLGRRYNRAPPWLGKQRGDERVEPAEINSGDELRGRQRCGISLQTVPGEMAAKGWPRPHLHPSTRASQSFCPDQVSARSLGITCSQFALH